MLLQKMDDYICEGNDEAKVKDLVKDIESKLGVSKKIKA